jgi:hypothetical protein
MHSVTTTTGLDDQYQPRDRTSTFTTNERVYIVYQLSEAHPGEVVTFTCVFNEVVQWNGVHGIAAGGNYTGYFVLGPLPTAGTYRGELVYRGELHTVYWEVHAAVPPTLTPSAMPTTAPTAVPPIPTLEPTASPTPEPTPSAMPTTAPTAGARVQKSHGLLLHSAGRQVGTSRTWHI